MVRAVQNLVAGSVAGMKPDAVNAIDQHGKTPSAGNRREPWPARPPRTPRAAGRGPHRQDRPGPARQRVGPGKARVKVTAELDLNRGDHPGAQASTRTASGHPLGKHQRQQRQRDQERRHRRRSPRPRTSRARTPNGFQPVGSKQDSNESVTNYEIGETNRTTVKEPGA